MTKKNTPPDHEQGNKVAQSALGRGVAILRCFSTTEPDLNAKELMARTGLPKATLFRILANLRELGLIRYSERHARFTLAASVLALGAPVLSCMAIRQLASPLMQSLADAYHGQMSLAVGEGADFLYVELVQGASSTVYRPTLGSSASITRSASGRAYLSSLDPAERTSLIDKLTRNDPERKQWLQEKLDETQHDLRTKGYCRNQGELARDVVGSAVPMRDPTTEGRVFAFGFSLPSYRLVQEPTLLDDIGMRLVALVRNVETAMGRP